jgi:hypothetical protein
VLPVSNNPIHLSVLVKIIFYVWHELKVDWEALTEYIQAKLSVVVHSYNPNTRGGRGRRISNSKLAGLHSKTLFKK